MKTAGIIGGMDFIGCYITLKFLSEDYRVKVPVSNLTQKNGLLNMECLLANENLEICKTNLDDFFDLKEFMQGCDLIVHCGNPKKLGEKMNGNFLYITQIKGTAQLLKATRQIPSVEKIIFITSPAIYNISPRESLVRTDKTAENESFKKARFHADLAIQNLLEDFPEDFFEIFIMAPAEIKDNTLLNSSESISSGLQFLFRNITDHDPVLQKLFKRNLMQTMVDIQQLPEKVFKAVCQKIQVEEINN